MPKISCPGLRSSYSDIGASLGLLYETFKISRKSFKFVLFRTNKCM